MAGVGPWREAGTAEMQEQREGVKHQGGSCPPTDHAYERPLIKDLENLGLCDSEEQKRGWNGSEAYWAPSLFFILAYPPTLRSRPRG